LKRFFLCLFILSGVSFLYGQSTFGTIVGVVKDPAGAVIAQAQVAVTNEGTNVTQRTSTDQNGRYEVSHLNPGSYTVALQSTGFAQFQDRNILLETGQILRIDVQLSLGSVSETISVTGQAAAIDTETGTISDVRTGKQVIELPYNFVRGDAFSGGVYKYVGLSPGAYSKTTGSGNAYSGSRAGQGTATFDGITLGDQGGATPNPAQPSFESIQEVKLMTVNTSAEYGYLATVAMISKSGTNQLHGSAFHQYGSGSLNARNFFQNSSPFRVYNEFGGSIGGPVVLPGYNGRNRTFFFFAYEGSRDHRQTLFNVSVPTALMRRGDFSRTTGTGGSLIVVRDPLNNQPFAGNIIPASRISPISTKVQNQFYPLPNFGSEDQYSQNLRATEPMGPTWNHIDLRADHKISEKNLAYARFSWRRIPNPKPAGELPNSGMVEQIRQMHNMSLVDTHTLSPRVINEFRGGYAWHENPRWGPYNGLDTVRDLGIRGLTGNRDVRGGPIFSMTGFAGVTTTAFDRPQEMTYDFLDSVTVIRGRHTLKAGFNLRKNQTSREPIPNAVFGQYTFTGAFSNFAWSDFLLGLPQTTQRANARGRTYGRNQAYAGYVQDDFKVNPNLTLNLGIRYEWNNPFADRYDRMFNFDPATGNLVVPNSLVLTRDVSPIFPSSIKVVTAQDAGFPARGLRTTDGNNFAPRVGVAWRPFGNNRSVLRGGFGVYHTPLTSTVFEFLNQGPFISNETFTNRVTNGVPLFQFPEPFLPLGTLGSQDVTAVERNLFNPYSMQWNLTAEREALGMVFRASYIGTRSVDLLYRRNLNQPVASVVPFSNDRRAYPQYRNVIMVSNGTSSSYHSLQAEVERRFSKGLFFQLGYTLARQLADGNDTGDEGVVIENTYNRAAEKGDDLNLHRHRVIANFTWELPVGGGKRWLNGKGSIPAHILGGWQLAGIALFQTGAYFHPTFTGRDPSNTNTVGGRPDRIVDGNLSSGQRTIDRWFDVSAFAVPPVNAGRFGNSATGVLVGPGTTNYDLSLVKVLRFRERGKVQLSLSTTDVLNHPNMAIPNANISAPATVGRITATQGREEAASRSVMLGTRIEF
jgi:Carboxypeptidase regulatory-like domain/TonB dependent receptor